MIDPWTAGVVAGVLIFAALVLARVLRRHRLRVDEAIDDLRHDYEQGLRHLRARASSGDTDTAVVARIVRIERAVATLTERLKERKS